MSTMASQITNLTIVCSTVCSGGDQRKHQSSSSLSFVWGIHRSPVNSPQKRPVTQKMFPFDDVIMIFLQQPDSDPAGKTLKRFSWYQNYLAEFCIDIIFVPKPLDLILLWRSQQGSGNQSRFLPPRFFSLILSFYLSFRMYFCYYLSVRFCSLTHPPTRPTHTHTHVPHMHKRYWVPYTNRKTYEPRYHDMQYIAL